jgi:anti-anti-sigma regulatory factor
VAGLEVFPLLERPGVRVVGQVDTGTRSVWSDALGRLARSREELLYVEMSQVAFIDVAGVTDLAMTAQSMHGGQRIMVEQPPAQLLRILEIFWPDVDGIEVAP